MTIRPAQWLSTSGCKSSFNWLQFLLFSRSQKHMADAHIRAIDCDLLLLESCMLKAALDRPSGRGLQRRTLQSLTGRRNFSSGVHSLTPYRHCPLHSRKLIQRLTWGSTLHSVEDACVELATTVGVHEQPKRKGNNTLSFVISVSTVNWRTIK